MKRLIPAVLAILAAATLLAGYNTCQRYCLHEWKEGYRACRKVGFPAGCVTALETEFWTCWNACQP